MVSRDIGKKQTVQLNDRSADVVTKELSAIQNRMFDKAKTRISELTFPATTTDEVVAQINKQPGFIKADWCGDETCEKKLKKKNAIKSRCIIDKGETTCVVCGKPAKHTVIWGLQY